MFDPTHIEAVTKELQSIAPFEDRVEAFDRSVMNRAYYCAYGTLRIAIEQRHPGIFGNIGRHAILCRSLTEARDTLVRAIGTRLKNLKINRERADYEYDCQCSGTPAELCMNKSSSVLEKIDRALVEGSAKADHTQLRRPPNDRLMPLPRRMRELVEVMETIPFP